MSRAKLKNPYYLTPSKAAMLAQGDFSFLQTYFIGNKREQSEAMQKGITVHEIFYELMRCGNDLEKAKNLVKEPDKWPTKKESGLLVQDYKLKWFEQQEKENKIVYKDNLKPVIEAIQIALELNEIFYEYRRHRTEVEVVLESNKFQIAGILDIKSELRTADVKTTSKEFSSASEFIKWNEKSFAVQEIHYERLCELNNIKTIKPFLFHVFQLCWPYKIINVQLDRLFVEEVKKWYNLDIYPKWQALWKKLENHFGKYPFKRPENLQETVGLWSKAQSNGIYDFGKIHTAKPSDYFMSQIRKDIDRLQRAAVKEFNESQKKS